MPKSKKKEDLVRVIIEEDLGLSWATLAKAIENLQNLRDKYEGLFSNLRIDSEPNKYEEGYHLVLVGERPKTDDEKRREKEREAQNKEWRKEQYEKLKKEFGEKE